MIRFDRVTYRYGNKETSSILEEVSFSLESGEVTGLLGRNGSGKSTLAMLSGGLLVPSEGRVLLDGLDSAQNPHSLGCLIGLVFQNPDSQIIGSTVEEDIVFGLENLGIDREEMGKRLEMVLQWFELQQLRKQPIHHLSGGQKQKLALASILALRPAYLILDEPTSHLDPWFRREFWPLLNALQKDFQLGMLIITQQPEELLRFHRVLVLHKGKLCFDGTPQILWNHPERNAWGVRVPEEVLVSRKVD